MHNIIPSITIFGQTAAGMGQGKIIPVNPGPQAMKPQRIAITSAAVVLEGASPNGKPPAQQPH
jgi:hypothetical protein